MSLTSGGTAPKPFSSGGSSAASAGSGGIVAVFFAWNLPPSRYQVQIDPSRLVVSTTTPRKPYSRVGSCAGRISSAIWWLAPRSIVCTCLRAAQVPEVQRVAVACWPAGPRRRCRSRTAAAGPIRSTPCSRAAGSTRSRSAASAGRARSPTCRGSRSVSQSMMKTPGGPSRAVRAGAAERADVDALGPAVHRCAAANSRSCAAPPRARSPWRSSAAPGRAACRRCRCATSGCPG